MKSRKPRTLDEKVRLALELGARWAEGNAEAQAAIARFRDVLDQHEPPTPRQKAERRGLKVIEGGKTK